MLQLGCLRPPRHRHQCPPHPPSRIPSAVARNKRLTSGTRPNRRPTIKIPKPPSIPQFLNLEPAIRNRNVHSLHNLPSVLTFLSFWQGRHVGSFPKPSMPGKILNFPIPCLPVGFSERKLPGPFHIFMGSYYLFGTFLWGFHAN